MIINEYLSDDDYSFLMNASTYNLLLYEESYQHRISGVYFDSLAFKKPIIFNSNTFFDDQELRFGMIGIRFRNFDTLFNDLKKANYEAFLHSIAKATNYYSDANVLEDYNNIINKI